MAAEAEAAREARAKVNNKSNVLLVIIARTFIEVCYTYYWTWQAEFGQCGINGMYFNDII